MPTIYFHRTWCKTCNDWTLHNWRGKDSNMQCKECKTDFTDTTLGEIPEEKLLEQRKRYSEKKKSQFRELYKKFVAGSMLDRPSNMFLEMMAEDLPKTEITEEDAGQKSIDAEADRKRMEAIEKDRLERQHNREEYARYSHLGRNDTCICGSGKKYKKCCMQRVEGSKK